MASTLDSGSNGPGWNLALLSSRRSINLFLTEFEGRTVYYGLRFSPSIYGPSAKRAKGKNKGP